MTITRLLPAVSLILLTGCNYDLSSEIGGNLSTAETIDTATSTETDTEQTIDTPAPEETVVSNETEEEVVVEEETVVEEAPCNPCASERTIDLAWMPDSAVAGYRIYYGPDSNSVDQLLADLDENTPDFDFNAPAVSYHAWYDMGLFNGDNVCFSIESYDTDNNITILGAACGVLNA